MARPGRYRVVRKIADGGMAEIFLAVQRGAEGFERPVVLKRILAALVADPQFRNVLIDEAHVAMGLNHSNVAQVLDLGHAGGRYFLVLEFVDGWDLNLLINRVNAAGLPLPPELALYISAEVCRALSYAHARTRDGKPLGIVHRDISPHNVLVSEQGEVKLTDFGIAKALGRRERTGAGIIKGKLAFMSPEQASGQPLDARSDLFSMGTMLYLMTVGRRPFEAPTELEGILRVRQADFPAPAEIKPDIDPKLAAVITRAMRLRQDDRYQSAEELLVDIEAVQRTRFQPAGSTELKRWLNTLQETDGVPPISRAAPVPPANASEVSELVEGVDLVFDDDDAPDTTIPTGPPAELVKAAAVAPPPLPADARPTPAASVAPRPPHRLRALLLLAGAAAAGLIYTVIRPRPAPPPSPRPTAAAPPPPPLPSPTPPEKPAEKPADERAALPDAQAVVSAPPPDAEAVAAVAERAPDAGAEDDDQEEEALLKQRVPDAEKEVIGDDLPAPRRPATAKNAGGSKPPPEPPAVVSVLISTAPEGAVIRLKNRVFGRAPMKLRFRPGVPFELSFVKSGYVTRTKRFTFTTKKDQKVKVTLAKRPDKRPEKKGFFRRLFGG